jgi:hypothetical protein
MLFVDDYEDYAISLHYQDLGPTRLAVLVDDGLYRVS